VIKEQFDCGAVELLSIGLFSLAVRIWVSFPEPACQTPLLPITELVHVILQSILTIFLSPGFLWVGTYGRLHCYCLLSISDDIKM
ncbi:MAG: hypothetical protein WCI03_02495, partial [bacterium]